MRGYQTVVFFILRRMRMPLLMLLVVYGIAITGMTMIPGKVFNEESVKQEISLSLNKDGKFVGELKDIKVSDQESYDTWTMDFFHAVYFVSYMGTTIGFGEIPHEFTGAQRLWVIVSLYMTVICWIYAIGTLITLVQDETFQRALKEGRFLRSVNQLHEPFYIVCGYGETGRALIRSLEERFMRSVLLETEQTKVNDLIMENYPVHVPHLCADASKPRHLIEAGLTSKWCTGIIAVTGDNVKNLHIAITAHLLNSNVKLICQVDDREVARNMASFGADYQVQVNPFDIFAYQMQLALQYPRLYAVREWLAGRRETIHTEPMRLPRKGLWVLCGFGRFGQTLYNKLRKEKDIDIIVIEATPEKTGTPDGAFQVISGWGTEMVTLLEAKVNEAVGIIAGTDNDTNNLSIVVTARSLNPDLFVIIRQNKMSNQSLFDAIDADVVMQPSRIIADRMRVLLTTPLLVNFVTAIKQEKTEEWTVRHIIKPIKQLLLKSYYRDDFTAEASQKKFIPKPVIWELTLDEKNAPAILELSNGIKLKHLLTDPRNPEKHLPCVALFILDSHSNNQRLLPSENTCVSLGDRVLWCGTKEAMHWMNWILLDKATVTHITLGYYLPQGHVWRYIQKVRKQIHYKRSRTLTHEKSKET